MHQCAICLKNLNKNQRAVMDTQCSLARWEELANGRPATWSLRPLATWDPRLRLFPPVPVPHNYSPARRRTHKAVQVTVTSIALQWKPNIVAKTPRIMTTCWWCGVTANGHQPCGFYSCYKMQYFHPFWGRASWVGATGLVPVISKTFHLLACPNSTCSNSGWPGWIRTFTDISPFL